MWIQVLRLLPGERGRQLGTANIVRKAWVNLDESENVFTDLLLL